MRTTHPNSTFNFVVGAAAVLGLLFGMSTVHAVTNGCPDGWRPLDLVCLFLPTHTDFGVHLISYLLIGISLLSIVFGLGQYQRQVRHTRSILGKLSVVHPLNKQPWLLAGQLGFADKVRLLNYEAPFCFCAGLFAPRIYLSQSIVKKLRPEELEALLLHEQHHLKNHDPLKVLLGKVLTSAFFFVPVLQDLFNRWLIEKEIAADESAIRYQGHKKGIAGALAELLDETWLLPVEGAISSSTEALRYRIDHLTGSVPELPHFLSFRHLAASFLILAIIIAILLAPVQAAHPVTF